MDALLGAAVVDLMAAEGIEHPAFAGSHVRRLAATGEQHGRICDHGNMDSPVRAPILMAVDVHRHLGACPQPHQAATAPYRPHRGMICMM